MTKVQDPNGLRKFQAMRFCMEIILWGFDVDQKSAPDILRPGEDALANQWLHR
jgi:hypothetical protein